MMNKYYDYLRRYYIILIYIYFIFFYQYSFNFHLDNYKYYYVSILNFVGFIIALPTFKNWQASKFLILSILLFYHIQCVQIGNEYGIVLSTIISQLFILFPIQASPKRVFQIIIICLLIQLTWFYYPYLTSNIQEFGTFGNKGVFALYLACKLPIILYLFKETDLVIFKILLIALFVTVIISIILVESRTSFLICLLFLCIIFISKIKIRNFLNSKWKAILISSLAIILVFSLLVFLFNYKLGSSMGRILMLEVAKENFSSTFAWGVGLGQFEKLYPTWQAEYFAKNGYDNPSYFVSAGETYFLFNEPHQLIMTCGIFGIFLVLIAVKVIYKNLRKYNSLTAEKKVALNVFIIICFSSLTYYSLHINEIIFLFAFSLMLLFNKDTLSFKNIVFPLNLDLRRSAFLIFLSGLLIMGFYSFKNSYYSNKWNRSKWNPSNDFNEIYYSLRRDGRFLAEYSYYYLERNGNLESACFHLEKAKEIFYLRDIQEKLAILYKRIGKYEKAIDSFEQLSNFMPSKYRYKMEVADLCMQTGDYKRAKEVLFIIINMPTKIESVEVSLYKKQAEEMLLKLTEVK